MNHIKLLYDVGRAAVQEALHADVHAGATTKAVATYLKRYPDGDAPRGHVDAFLCPSPAETEILVNGSPLMGVVRFTADISARGGFTATAELTRGCVAITLPEGGLTVVDRLRGVVDLVKAVQSGDLVKAQDLADNLAQTLRNVRVSV